MHPKARDAIIPCEHSGGSQLVLCGPGAGAPPRVNRRSIGCWVMWASFAAGNTRGPTYGVCEPGEAWDDCHVYGFGCSGVTIYARRAMAVDGSLRRHAKSAIITCRSTASCFRVKRVLRRYPPPDLTITPHRHACARAWCYSTSYYRATCDSIVFVGPRAVGTYLPRNTARTRQQRVGARTDRGGSAYCSGLRHLNRPWLTGRRDELGLGPGRDAGGRSEKLARRTQGRTDHCDGLQPDP